MGFVYYPMHMHIHAGCDYGSSMALDMYNAHQLGMRYIWFTDHDTRMGIMKNRVGGFSFDTPDLIRMDVVGRYGFELVNEDVKYSVDTDNKSLTLYSKESADEWNSTGVYFVSRGTRHTSALASEITLSVDLKEFTPTADSRLIFAIKLSQRPPEMKNAYMLYVLGDTEGLEGEHIQVLNIDGCGKITMPISADVSERDDIGGKDNAFDTMYIILQTRNDAEAHAVVGDFDIHKEKIAEELHIALKEVASKVGEKYGVTPFVAFELSGSGEHKNCFNSSVPIIDYHARDYVMSEAEGVEWIKKHGGIFALNHPFAISRLRGSKIEDDHIRKDVLSHIFADFMAKNAFGATLIEIGFPEGRNFPEEYYLRLWDMFTQAGVFLAGYGSSDCHRNNTGWFDGNNFVAYIGVDDKLAHPISEEKFTTAMKKGNMYTADPTKIQGNIRFETKSGAQMGSVFLAPQTNSVNIIFSADNLKADWKFRLIENGEVIHEEIVGGENYTYSSTLSLGIDTVHFQRAELWDENGRCIMLTNPIHIVNTELFCREIPEERKAE
ncbi:MAG: CehA/McbA family metallohydrolase [Clostridia bacterium]|nr:CehA/McbA family metallohydrolase [Clostridia bacterium]